LKALQNISVMTLSGHPVGVSEFFAFQRTVLVVFRRFGCVICREAAFEISKIKPDLDDLSVRLIGVGFENDRSVINDFLAYWNGELFLDEGRKLYHALNVKRHNQSDAYGLLALQPYLNVLRAKRKGMQGTYWGADPFQLGGTFVVGPQPQGVLFAHRQQFYGDLANNEAVVEACRTPCFTFGVYDHD